MHPESENAISRKPLHERAIRGYVDAIDFPCVGARSAFNKQRVRYGAYGRLIGTDDVPALCVDLERFSEEYPEPGVDPVTFVAMFENEDLTETQFATRMWQLLQAIHERDSLRFDWDPTVSADPEAPNFSFSVAGRAFFVVGLHPRASRIARRSPMPCLVFNFHDQFECLRESGKYDGMQKVIRQRDMVLQGSINPVLDQFGLQSEARQYSGKPVDESWRCPFHQVESRRAA